MMNHIYFALLIAEYPGPDKPAAQASFYQNFIFCQAQKDLPLAGTALLLSSIKIDLFCDRIIINAQSLYIDRIIISSLFNYIFWPMA